MNGRTFQVHTFHDCYYTAQYIGGRKLCVRLGGCDQSAEVFFTNNFILADLLCKAGNTPMAFLCKIVQSTYIFSAKVLCDKVFYKKIFKHLIFLCSISNLELRENGFKLNHTHSSSHLAGDGNGNGSLM